MFLAIVVAVALAQDPTPVTDRPVVHVERGMLVPFDGVLSSDAQAIVQANTLIEAQNHRGWDPLLVVLGATGAAFVVGVVVWGACAGSHSCSVGPVSPSK